MCSYNLFWNKKKINGKIKSNEIEAWAEVSLKIRVTCVWAIIAKSDFFGVFVKFVNIVYLL